MNTQKQSQSLATTEAEEKLRITKLRTQEGYLKVGYSLMATLGLGVAAVVACKSPDPKPFCTSVSRPTVVTIIPERPEMHWIDVPPSVIFSRN